MYTNIAHIINLAVFSLSNEHSTLDKENIKKYV